MDEVARGNVAILNSTRATEISDRGVRVTDSQGQEFVVDADTVIVALDLAASDSRLAEGLAGMVREVYKIGDVKTFRRLKGAIHDGFTTDYSLS